MSRAHRFEFWQAKNGKWYFREIAANGEVVTPSEGYSTISNVHRAMRKRNPNAERKRVKK
jgi:uncharacterized protein YegP (UPF0339 family)